MIELHQFRPFWDLPNASPFCMKAETYLRFRGIEFKSVPSSPAKSPSRQVPFIIDGSETITDTENIIAHFEARQPHHIDEGLSDEQKAQGFFIRQLVEHQLFWQITYMRWGDPEGWKLFAPDLKNNLPKLMRGPMVYLIRRRLLRQMRFMGLKASDPAAAYMKGKAILDNLSGVLGARDFMLDDRPRSLDMSVYASLANIIDQRHSNPLQVHARGIDNLVAYCQRMQQLCYTA